MDRRERLAKWKKARAQAPEKAKSFHIKAERASLPRVTLGSAEPSHDHPSKSRGFLTEASAEPLAPKLSLDAYLGASVEYDPIDEHEYSESELESSTPARDVDAHVTAPAARPKRTPRVDHSQIQYEPYKKVFYRQHPSLDLDANALAQRRRTLGIFQSDSPLAPLDQWHQAGLPAPLMEFLSRFSQPTAVQAQALPIIMSGNDLVGVAPTGSGKTMAFLVPAVRHALENTGSDPSVLILVPTRELAVQIGAELGALLGGGGYLGVEYCVAAGGISVGAQITQLKKTSVNMVVGTPGRVIDLLTARALRLQCVTLVVLDETDRMFDMGFEPQVRRILQGVRPDRQTILFSATLSPRMQKVASTFVSPTSSSSLVVGTHSSVSPLVDQVVEVVDSSNRFLKLLAVLGDHLASGGEALVFVDTQESAESLTSRLQRHGFRAGSLHGGKPQNERTDAVLRFKSRDIDVLVATSVAARGLDVFGLTLVVNYDPPSHVEDYVHRAGRTGRAGLRGTALTLITPEQPRAAYDVAAALRMSGLAVPDDIEAIIKDHPEFTVSYGFGGMGLNRLDLKRARQARENSGGTGQDIQEEEQGEDESIETMEDPEVILGRSKNRFVAQLLINDFPREARAAVTGPATQEQVSDRYGVTLVGKGTFGSRDDKLRVEIEGLSEDDVVAAYKELWVLLHQFQGRKYAI